MSIASDLLAQHVQTLVDDNARWQTLLADEVLWELAYAPSLGHPAKLSGKAEAVRHTFATMLRAKGFTHEDIQAILGHSSRVTTEIYAKLTFTPEIKDRYLQFFDGGL